MSTLDSVTDTLDDKVGPFPVWGWGVALGGVAVAYMWFARNAAQSDTATTPGADGLDTNLQNAESVQNADDAALFTGNNSNDQTDPTPVINNYYSNDGTPATTGIQTQSLWVAKGVSYMVGRGNSPIPVQNALNAYLGHRPLSPTQQVIVNAVIQHQGTPPGFGTGAIPVQHAPAPKQPNGGTHATPHMQAYKVKHNDTRTTIVRHFWGSASQTHLEAFRRMNGFGKDYHLHDGQMVKVKA